MPQKKRVCLAYKYVNGTPDSKEEEGRFSVWSVCVCLHVDGVVDILYAYILHVDINESCCFMETKPEYYQGFYCCLIDSVFVH